MHLHGQRRLHRPGVIVLAVALSIGMLAGPATAAAPVYLNSDGDCIDGSGIPPSSTRTLSVSTEDLSVVVDHTRSKLTESHVIWQLVNLDTGLVEFVNLGAGALGGWCSVGGEWSVDYLYDATSGWVQGSHLSAGARYLLHLQDNTVGTYKNLRFSTVP